MNHLILLYYRIIERESVNLNRVNIYQVQDFRFKNSILTTSIHERQYNRRREDIIPWDIFIAKIEPCYYKGER